MTGTRGSANRSHSTHDQRDEPPSPRPSRTSNTSDPSIHRTCNPPPRQRLPRTLQCRTVTTQFLQRKSRGSASDTAHAVDTPARAQTSAKSHAQLCLPPGIQQTCPPSDHTPHALHSILILTWCSHVVVLRDPDRRRMECSVCGRGAAFRGRRCARLRHTNVQHTT